MNKEKVILINAEIDIARAAYEGKLFAKDIGFIESGQYMIATVISELARNIYRYALRGDIKLKTIGNGGKKGIEIIAEDVGNGIKDIGQVMMDEFSTSDSLGLGLPGVKRIMDEFTIDSKIGIGTSIRARKWL